MFVRTNRTLSAAASLVALAASIAAPAAANPRPILARAIAHGFMPLVRSVGPATIQHLHTVTTVGSTQDVANGDGNPYGLALSPTNNGKILSQHFLVCNFNDGFNIQSLGTTLETIGFTPGTSKVSRVSSDPRFTGCGAIALSPKVIFMTSYTANEIVGLDYNGNIVGTLTDNSLAGPWGMTYGNPSRPELFVSNAYTGNIVRINLSGPTPTFTTIVTGIQPNHGVPGTILAPSGLTYVAATDTLAVVDGLGNRFFTFSHASALPSNAVVVGPTGFSGPGAVYSKVLFTGAPLNAPVSAAYIPFNGHFVIGNTGDNNMVEISGNGGLVGTRLVDAGAAGAIFGIVATGTSDLNAKIYFNDDNDNTLKVLQLP